MLNYNELPEYFATESSFRTEIFFKIYLAGKSITPHLAGMTIQLSRNVLNLRYAEFLTNLIF